MASSRPSDTYDESSSDVYSDPDWDYGHDPDSSDGMQDKSDDEQLELPESNGAEDFTDVIIVGVFAYFVVKHWGRFLWEKVVWPKVAGGLKW